jgi:type VI secretion system protein ImpM
VTGAAIFGKLPSHGDFVARGMAPAERDTLDLWLSASMANARSAYGDGFETLYDQAPPWRFAQPREGGWIVGALVPSVDSVGRRFPVLARRFANDDDAVTHAAMHCERVLYDAFAAGWNADSLTAAVAGDMVESEDDWPGHAGWWTMGGDDHDAATLPGDQPPDLVRTMLIRRSAAA